MPNRNSRDVVFTFFMESWKNAVGREMYMAGPRLLATLMSEPSIERLLVANPFRSTPIQWARKSWAKGRHLFQVMVATRWLNRGGSVAVIRRQSERSNGLMLLMIGHWRPPQRTLVLIGR